MSHIVDQGDALRIDHRSGFDLARPSQPRIGVAVPTLNSGKTLSWTLLALKNQVQMSVEVLVADSGSTDDTLTICDRFEVPHIYVPRGNMYRAVNAALKTFTTPWLAYLNSDDVVYSTSYGRLISVGEQANAAVAYGLCDYMDFDGRYLFSRVPARPSVLSRLLRNGVMGLSQPASVFRREIFERLGGFSETERTVSDYDFFLRADIAGSRFTRLAGKSVAAFRVHDAQLSQVARHGIGAETARVLEASGIPKQRRDWSAQWQWRFENVAEIAQRHLFASRRGRD